MNLLDALVAIGIWRPKAGSPAPDDDFWYGPPGSLTASGTRVSPNSALRVAAIFECIRVVTETMAMLPLITYRQIPSGGKERATNHPLYTVLHDKPNEWQTAFEFREMMQGHLELRGNAYAEILPGPRGFADQLIPLHPDQVTVEQLSTGRILYHYSDPRGMMRIIPQEGMHHLRGFSQGGIVGMSTIEVQRETIGKAAASTEYGARFFANDATPGGVLEHPHVLEEETAKRIKRSWQAAQTGKNRHKIAVLEDGMKYNQIGMTNRDAQYLESTEATTTDIAAMFRVPPHKIGRLGRATWNNIESQSIAWVVDGVLPRARRWEAAIGRDLILRPDIYFAEFLIEGLLRGDIKSRYEAYQIAFNNGWMNDNEIREKENMNPREGGDRYYVSSQVVPADEPRALPAGGSAARTTKSVKARLQLIAEGAAGRVIRVEVGALRRAAQAGRFSEFVDSFYDGHADFVASAMRISAEKAKTYTEAHRETVKFVTKRPDMEDIFREWEESGPAHLAALALEVEE